MISWMKKRIRFWTKRQSIRLYQTIETLPIWKWEEIKKTGDYRYLIIDGNGTADLEALWVLLQDEFAEKVGMSGSGGHYMGKFMDLQELRRQSIIQGCDEFNPNLSKTNVKKKLLEGELDEMPISKQKIDDQAIQMEIFFNTEPGAFNPRVMSTFRWHKYMNEYERRIEELQRSEKNT